MYVFSHNSSSRSVFLLITLIIISWPLYAEKSQDFINFISRSVPLRCDGKIAISECIRHVKLDIGLSYSAPISQQWLSCEENLIVFGFEPNPASVTSIINGAVKVDPSHGEPLEKKYVGTRFFLIPCALGLSHVRTVPFYITAADGGCSSLFAPQEFVVERVIEVPIFPLKDFFELFPFDTHPLIDYIKIDAQGADLDIIKSAGHYLAKHVIYITLEAENLQYQGTENSELAIDIYMKSIGFIRQKVATTQDPTYLNSRYTEYIKQHCVKIYQKG